MAQSPRRSPALVLGVGVALLLGFALIGTSRLGAETDPPRVQERAAATPASPLLDGIPQDGTVLGRPDAPVTLIEYADLQCPYCAQWARGALPLLVREYVRTGKLRIEFRGLAFIGPDSDTALRAALAAGRQNRLWNVVELLYADQGPRTPAGRASSWSIASHRASRASTSSASTPTDGSRHSTRKWPRHRLRLGPTGSTPETLEVTSLAPDEFAAAIEALLGR